MGTGPVAFVNRTHASTAERESLNSVHTFLIARHGAIVATINVITSSLMMDDLKPVLKRAAFIARDETKSVIMWPELLLMKGVSFCELLLTSCCSQLCLC